MNTKTFYHRASTTTVTVNDDDSVVITTREMVSNTEPDKITTTYLDAEMMAFVKKQLLEND